MGRSEATQTEYSIGAASLRKGVKDCEGRPLATGKASQRTVGMNARQLAECKAGDIGLERISAEENQCACQNNSLANFPANSRAISRESSESLFA
jgi:hypothetical protein